MAGLLEIILQDRYGAPKVVASGPFVEHRWNDDVERLRCVLYKSSESGQGLMRSFNILSPIYGDAVGASLLLGVLKVSMLQGPEVFGLYRIEELQSQPEVRRANSSDSSICFFMDSANVWYYGLKDGGLYVYDSGTQDLDLLGPVESELNKLLDQWERAKA